MKTFHYIEKVNFIKIFFKNKVTIFNPKITKKPGKTPSLFVILILSIRKFPVPFFFQIFSRDEFERRSVYTVSKSSFFSRSVVKQVSQMTSSIFAFYFGTNQTVAHIIVLRDEVRMNRLCKTRPSTPSVILIAGRE